MYLGRKELYNLKILYENCIFYKKTLVVRNNFSIFVPS